MTDEEIEALAASCQTRQEALARQGWGMAGIGEHYTHILLEKLLGAVAVKRCREEQLAWLAEQLDAGEAQARRVHSAQLLGIAPQLNGGSHA